MAMLLLHGGETVNHQSKLSSSSSSSSFNYHCSSRGSNMLQQEENRCNSNNRSNKKPKQKKIPQRGLGVAQLEKIRLEEQQKKEASDASISASPCYIPLPKSHPFSPPLTPNSSLQRSPSLPDSVFSVPNLHHHFSPSFIQNLNNPSLIDSCSATPNHGFLPWPSFGDESSQNHETEIPKMEHFGFRSSIKDSTRLFDLGSSGLTGKNNIFLNKPLLSSSSSSSQMEPPSNQSYNSSNIATPWIEEERIASMKRPRSFFFDNPFHGKSPCLSGSYYRSEDLTAHGPSKFESGNTILRDSYCSISTEVQINWKSSSSSESDTKITKDNGVLDGAFLTLGPSHSFPKCTQPSTFSHQNFSNFQFFRPQETIGETSNGDVFLHSELHQQPFYGFMERGSNSRAMGSDEIRAGEGADTPLIDLNLKL